MSANYITNYLNSKTILLFVIYGYWSSWRQALTWDFSVSTVLSFKYQLVQTQINRGKVDKDVQTSVTSWLLFFLLIAVCHINQMPASLPGHKVNIVKTEQTTGKPSYFSALLWWDIWIWILICNLYIPSERTRSTTDLYILFYVLIILYSIKKHFWA